MMSPTLMSDACFGTISSAWEVLSKTGSMLFVSVNSAHMTFGMSSCTWSL